MQLKEKGRAAVGNGRVILRNEGQAILSCDRGWYWTRQGLGPSSGSPIGKVL